jgi:hypothetical protein
MMQVGDFITKHCKVLLESKRRAMAYAVIFAILPFTSWLSIALVSLVTLRKGARSGFDVLLPALVIHSVPLMMLIPASSALINALLAYFPCYFAALSLRKTEKWQMAFGVLFIQAFLGCLVIQLLTPELIVDQFNQFKAILMQYHELVDTTLFDMNSLVLAQLFFGIQILSIIVSSIISLIFARTTQAKIFLPGGFRNELMTFRSGRFSFLVFVGILLASYYEIPIAINVLPMVLCYFLASGLGLVYFICVNKNQFKIFVLLMLLMFLRPTVVLCTYIVIGSLDSIFNFRAYLPSRVRESI